MPPKLERHAGEEFRSSLEECSSWPECVTSVFCSVRKVQLVWGWRRMATAGGFSSEHAKHTKSKKRLRGSTINCLRWFFIIYVNFATKPPEFE